MSPNFSRAHGAYSFYLSIMGYHEQALEEARRARELDPLSIFANLGVSRALFLARQYDEAIIETKKVIELDNGYFFAIDRLTYIYEAKGMHSEALAAYEELNRGGGDANISGQIYFGAACARAGEREKAQAILKRLETTKEYVSPGELPVLYIALGEREKALASLEKAYAAHDLQLQNLTTDPAFDPLRNDSRFQDLARRVGFPTSENTRVRMTDEADAPSYKAKTKTDLTTQSQAISGKNRKDIFIGSLIIFLLAAAGFGCYLFWAKNQALSASGKNKKDFFIGGVIISVLAAGFGYYLLSAKKSASGAGGKRTLAVLPFVNASRDVNAEYLSDGITESVINDLSQLSGLKVMSRNSAFRFKNDQTDTQAIAA